MAGRPSHHDFLQRAGIEFHAKAYDGSDAGVWRLKSSRVLPSPDEQRFPGMQSYELVFSAALALPQSIYRLSTPDGWQCEVFAVPTSATEMHVVVN